MNLINRDTDYATRAVMHIAESKKDLVSTVELERALELPRSFLRKVLQILQKNGILASVKGNKGGFSLARPAAKIFLMDLIRIFQGELTLTECMFRNKVCKCVKKCPIRKNLLAIEKTVQSKLKGVSIKTLLEQ